MSESFDMDAPVTRRELHEALEIWGGALTRQITANVTREVIGQVKGLIEDSEKRLTQEVRGQVGGSADELAVRLRVIDDKYADMPDRVSRLEAKVFAPAKRRITARRRKRS